MNWHLACLQVACNGILVFNWIRLKENLGRKDGVVDANLFHFHSCPWLLLRGGGCRTRAGNVDVGYVGQGQAGRKGGEKFYSSTWVHIKDWVREVVSMHFANSSWLVLAFKIFTSIQLRHAKEGLVWTDADAPGRTKFCERVHRVVTCEVKNHAKT